jgi:hypothetical protein
MGLLDVVDTVRALLFRETGGGLGGWLRPLGASLFLPAAGLGLAAAGAAARPRLLVDVTLLLSCLVALVVGLGFLGLALPRALPQVDAGVAWTFTGALLRIGAGMLLFAWILWTVVGRLRARPYGTPGSARDATG